MASYILLKTRYKERKEGRYLPTEVGTYTVSVVSAWFNLVQSRTKVVIIKLQIILYYFFDHVLKLYYKNVPLIKKI